MVTVHNIQQSMEATTPRKNKLARTTGFNNTSLSNFIGWNMKKGSKVTTPQKNTFRVTKRVGQLFRYRRIMPQKAHINAAVNVSKSPKGFIFRIKLPLKTTNATPVSAINEPQISCDVSRSLWKNNRDRKAVRMGAVLIISETFEASVIPKAVFSVRKQRDPPLSPAATNINSSLRLLANSLRGDMNQIHT